ncbi:MAG: PEP/pyruvate-binding domain-containing protein [Clostridiales bacterium]
MIYNFNEKNIPVLLQVGSKAKALIETTNAGFPVPEGIVLSVEFFKTWLEAVKSSEQFKTALLSTTKENCDSVKTIALGMRFDDAQQQEVDKYVSSLKGHIFAIRSSSPEEDLEGKSFAGMYETYLGTKRDDIEKIVVLTFSSCFDYRVMDYKKKNGLTLQNTSIAIIIQRQVESDVSGVGFSLNPLNNAYDEVVINASFGLGETIVSGTVTPDMYTYDFVKKNIIEKKVNTKEVGLWIGENGSIIEKENIQKDKQALTDEQIVKLSTLIKNCEKHYGKPMDIEWAFENDVLYLLQSRPITTYLPFFKEFLTKPGESKRFYIDLMILTQGFDEPMSVLGMNLWSEMLYIIKGGMMSFQVNGTAPTIYGREYISITAYQKVAGKRNANKFLDNYDGNLKKIFEGINLNEHPYKGRPDGTKGFVKKTFKIFLGMLPVVLKSVFADYNEVIKDYKRTTDNIIINTRKLNKDVNFKEISEVIVTNIYSLMSKTALIFAGMIAQRSIKKMFKGENIESELIALNMDLDGNPTSEMGNLLFYMACTSDFKKVSSREDFVKKAENRKYSSEFLKLYDEFMEKFSVRGFKEIDVASKRIYEDIGILYDKLIEINTDENQILTVEEKREEVYNKLLKISKEKGKEKKFVKAAMKLKATFGYREHPKYMIVCIYAMLHKICLEIGEKWVIEGRLEDKYQIFDLKIDEISRAQRDHKFDLMKVREKNLEGYKKVEHVTEWPLVIDSRGKIYKPKLELKDGDIIGDSIAPGKVVGKAKVLHSPYEKSLYPGEILIARMTEPSWTPIFTNAVGVIMEIGGPLQHGGIIAREYGIPCVSGLVGIMDIVKDGDLLEVDGYNGVVRLLER